MSVSANENGFLASIKKMSLFSMTYVTLLASAGRFGWPDYAVEAELVNNRTQQIQPIHSDLN
jgi:hypothetical protein